MVTDPTVLNEIDGRATWGVPVSSAVASSPHVAAAPAKPARLRIDHVIAAVAVADSVVISLAVFAAIQLKFGSGLSAPQGVDSYTGVPLIDFGWLVPAWLCALAASDSYSRRQFARGTDEFRAVLKGTAWAAAAVTMAAYLLNYDMSRGFFALSFGLGTLLLVLQRAGARAVVTRMRAGNRMMHRVVAVGGAGAVTELHSALSREPSLGYRLVGACVPVGGIAPPGVPVLGAVGEAVASCRAAGADTLVVVSGTFDSSMELRRIGWELEGDDIDLIVMPSLVDIAGPRIRMRPVAGLPFVHIDPPQVARALRWRKALFDRVGSAALLLLLAPVMAAVAVAIKLEGGAVLFRHRRIGVGGRSFDVLKFRSMVSDAAASHNALVDAHASGVLLFKLRDDPRITRVGRFIRKYSLDELPQLINVLRGDMSLVGPRPQVEEEVATYDSRMERRLLVRPGITGLWQVSGRSNLSVEESTRLDVCYVDNWSMAGDVVILAKTIAAVLRHDGAY